MGASVMRVGIVAPMWSEAECFVAAGAQRARAEHSTPQPIMWMGEGVHLCVSGIGSERAVRAARELLSQGATALASFGVAGGLDPRLTPGDIVLADRVLAADGEEHTTDAAWRDALSNRLRAELSCTIGAMCESTGVLAGTAEKAARFRDSRAIAVDMESAAIAAAAARANVPCLVLRAVCDPADMCIPRCALAATDVHGRPRLAQFALGLLAHPTEIRDVFRLQRAFRAAANALTNAARIAGPRLCAPEG